jgi:hypothetical protein
MTAAVGTLLALACVVLAFVFLGRRAFIRENVSKVDGSFARQFVWVEDDGSVRELTPDELAYLNTEFHPADGARPYIKSRYSARSVDDRLSGFLPRTKVPRRIEIRA